MKTLSEKINEALYASVFTVGSGTDEDDLLTREYGNLYGMFSNTFLRRTPFNCYVLTGSALRSGTEFLFAPQFTAKGKTAAEWFSDHSLRLYKPDGECINCPNYDSSDNEEIGSPSIELLGNVSGYIKDNDYLVVF